MKSTTYLTTTLIAAFTFHILFVALLKDNFGYVPASLISGGAIIMLFLLTPLRRRLIESAFSVFYKNSYDSQKVLRESVKALVTILDLDQLLSYFIHIIVDNMKPGKAAIFLFVEEKGFYKSFA